LFRPWFLITLLVALSGTPLRLAEAAEDLSRSVVGPVDEGEIEEVDGGVGDEPEDVIRASVVQESASPAVFEFTTVLPHFLPFPECPSRLRRGASPPSLSILGVRVHLWLQCFLC
jgi:hypothetical protein